MSSFRVAVIIPAYCEERLIAKTISSVPSSVEEIIVVDDGSNDATIERAKSTGDSRVTVLAHSHNQGVGAAIYTGYRQALCGNADVFVVMAGDNQMDGRDLPSLVSLMATDGADYVKGDRLSHERASDMPRHRRYGTTILAFFTSLAAGIRLRDTQCGYTAISRRAARLLQGSSLWSRYGYPNDLLIFLARRGAVVREVPVRPVYADEASGLRFWHFLTIFLLIVRRTLLEFPSRSQNMRLDEASRSTAFAPRADGG